MSRAPHPVPMLDLSSEIEALWPELRAAVEGVIRSGRFILGPNLEAFETEVAEYLGTSHAVGVNSGTDALVIALRSLGVGAGDEVITSAYSFFATAEAVSQVGATPIFVDIDPHTYNLDPGGIEACLGPRTRAVIPVHLFGHAADMDPILELANRHGLAVIEDVAQAFGGRYRGRVLGGLGHAGAFSFFPSKNLGAYGDGGLVVTDDAAVAEAARMLRNHGSKSRYRNEMLGYNSRLDELQAAILRVKLGRVEAANARRREVAGRYRELLAGLPHVTTPGEADYAHHVYHQYTLRIAGGGRDAARKRLGEADIASAIYYPTPLHRSPPYADRARALPVAERASQELLSLPIWPDLDLATQRRIAEAVRGAPDGTARVP